jgi:hypothetical protein
MGEPGKLQGHPEVHQSSEAITASDDGSGFVMTNLQWAIICTIHQESMYTFRGSELRAAKRMVDRGWLKPASFPRHIPGRFDVTASGERAYARA